MNQLKKWIRHNLFDYKRWGFPHNRSQSDYMDSALRYLGGDRYDYEDTAYELIHRVLHPEWWAKVDRLRASER